MASDLPPAIPCPWCGAVPGINDVIGEYNEGGLYIRLRCPNGDQECMAEGPWTVYLGESLSPEDLFKEAVIPWNSRHESGELSKLFRGGKVTCIDYIFEDETYTWSKLNNTLCNCMDSGKINGPCYILTVVNEPYGNKNWLKYYPSDMLIDELKRRGVPPLSYITNISLMAESVRRGLAEVESGELPGWLREKINNRISKIETEISSIKRTGPSVDREYLFNKISSLEWVLSLKRGE